MGTNQVVDPSATESGAALRLVRDLIARQAESRSLDYKAAMSFGPAKQVRAEILKWIMAFANSRDGGYILVGVREVGGTFQAEGVSPGQAISFDPTDIGTFAKNYCSMLPVVAVQAIVLEGKTLVLIRVEEFDNEPIVCIKDCHDTSGKKLVLRAGSIYVRTPDARSAAIESGEEMRTLLDLAVQKRGDALLRQIGRLVGPVTSASAGERVSEYFLDLNGAYSLFDAENLTAPYWHVEVMPFEYMADRVMTNSRLREIRRDAVVSVRGWDFPHVDHQNDRTFEHGIESFVHWSRYNEAHRLYKSGLFAWRRKLAEDSDDEYKGTLSYVSSIYSITEFFIFANRYSGLLLDEGRISIRLGVVGLGGRVLRLDNDGFKDEYSTGAQSFERAYDIPVEDLRAKHMELAAEVASQLFDLYGLDMSTDVIATWQKKLIERRF